MSRPSAHPRQLAASSVSLALTSRLAATTTDWHVHSSHAHACNLRCADLPPIALVAPDVGNGPFHIVVAGAPFHMIEPGAPVVVTRESITLPNCVVDLRPARKWQPRVTLPLPVAIAANDDFLWLHEDTASSASPLLTHPGRPQSPLQRLADASIARLRRGLQDCALAEVASAAQCLAGLGPGLTPAGDDFLLGWLFGLYCGQSRLAAHGLSFAAIAASVVTGAPARTTWLSSAWLYHAAQGEFSEPWHALANGLATSRSATAQAIQLLRGRGATSGEDALAGLLEVVASLASSGSVF